MHPFNIHRSSNKVQVSIIKRMGLYQVSVNIFSAESVYIGTIPADGLAPDGTKPPAMHRDDHKVFLDIPELQIAIYWWIHLPNCQFYLPQVIGQWDMLTHWGRDKMAAFSQTALSNAFSWMKILEFRLKFHWCLFLRVLLTIFQHWFW